MKESGWESLRDRRKNHKLIMFHQMVNKNTPDYLTNLVPSTFGQTHSYGTRNSHNLPSVHVHVQMFITTVLFRLLFVFGMNFLFILEPLLCTLLKFVYKINTLSRNIFIAAAELVKLCTQESEQRVVD